jgi:hypothetical protein
VVKVISRVPERQRKLLAGGRCGRRWHGGTPEPPLVDRESVWWRDDDGALDDILELPNVGGPAIGPESIKGPLADGRCLLSGSLRVTHDLVESVISVVAGSPNVILEPLHRVLPQGPPNVAESPMHSD